MSIDAQIKRLEEELSALTKAIGELTVVATFFIQRPIAKEPVRDGITITSIAHPPIADDIGFQEAVAEPEVEPEVETKKIERADVSAACRALQQKDGNSDRAKAVLAGFGAKKVPDLTDAQLADAYYAFEAAATEEELA